MKVWLDAQLSPQLARWLSDRFQLDVVCVRDIGLRDSQDEQIFLAAREADAVVMTKDHDFVLLLLEEVWGEATRLLETGNPLVEIGEKSFRVG